MQLDMYLFYHGECADALALYQTVLGAQIHAMIRFRDTPDAANVAPEWQDKVMHAIFGVGGTTLMVSDGQFGQPKKDYQGFTLSIAANDAPSGENIFRQLAEGGEVLTPWQSTFFTAGFGMVKDRFGIPWLINVVSQLEETPQSAESA